MIDEIIDRLVQWIEQGNYHGHDIYDLYDHVPYYHTLLKVSPFIFEKIIRKIISFFILIAPKQFIKIFRVRKNINAKAMGLILKAYCNLYRIRNEKKYLESAEKIAYWLASNKSVGYRHDCWGYPFDWTGKYFIPRNTPSSVVSSVVGDGFFSLYKITGKKEYLAICESICLFFINELKADQISNSKICFSYTPIDNAHVHNANLFVAEFLIRIGKEINREDFVEIGLKAVNYTIAEQREDGSIMYWGDADYRFRRFSLSNMDHYHAGFEIRMLYTISHMLDDSKILQAYKNYYAFYKKNYLETPYINYRPGKRYPVDIHSCSEAIICNSIVENGNNTRETWLSDIIGWINSKMIDEMGLYIYQLRKLGFLEFKVKVHFLRWGQAWMLLALTEYLLSQKVSMLQQEK